MPVPTDIESLGKLFQKLGAPDPEGWASSQVSENIPQLHRFLFLRQAWGLIVEDGNNSWIEASVNAASRNPDEPYAGVGLAAKRCLEMGAAPDDLTEIVRGMQAELLFGLCYLLDDPSLSEPELEDVGWCLVETDGDFEPTDSVIGGLHESVLETDPTGREMRPPK